MRVATLLALCAAAVCLPYANAASTVLFVDNKDGTFFQPSSSVGRISPSALSALPSCILSVAPDTPVSPQVSREVEDLLSQNVFSRPQVLLFIQMAGTDTDVHKVDQDSLSGGLPARKMVVQDSFISVVASLEKGWSPGMQSSGLTYQSLDYTQLPGCADACVEQLLQEALPDLQASYALGPGPLKGQLSLPAADGSAVTLDLQEVTARLWSVETATLHRTVSDAAEEKLRRDKQGGSTVSQGQVLQATLVGLQALRDAYGTGSAEHLAAWDATVRLLPALNRRLAAAYSDRVAAQYVLLGTVPTPAGGVKNLLGWQELQRRRQLAQFDDLGVELDPVLLYVAWQTKAAAWLSGIILLVFLSAGVFVLVTMKFKKDSLLYSRAKVD